MMMMISIPAFPVLMALIGSVPFVLSLVDKDDRPLAIFGMLFIAVVLFFMAYGVCAMMGA